MNGKYIALGIAFGAALGAAFDNVAVGVALGVTFGVILASRGAYRRRQNAPADRREPS